ncbi:hypothetical protein [Hymenobacter sp.]|uniref:hypothetical protein n=1 Tax=Hymenobacter sp. TaxID=1898978 RepID=UPI002869F60A|nr:hypothetical protein [Hymenobacter sp.]
MLHLAKSEVPLLLLGLLPGLALGYLAGWRRAAARLRELHLLAHRKQEIIDALKWESVQPAPGS